MWSINLTAYGAGRAAETGSPAGEPMEVQAMGQWARVSKVKGVVHLKEAEKDSLERMPMLVNA